RQLDILFGSNTVAHIEWSLDAELSDVLGNHRRSGIGAPADDRIGLDTADLGQLRGHIGVFRAVNLVGHYGKALLFGQGLDLLAPGGTEAVGYRQQSETLLLFTGHVVQDLFGSDMVIGRSLEHPWLDRIGDFDPGSACNQGDLLFFDDRNNRHALSGGAW